jgi:hypothetical protein
MICSYYHAMQVCAKTISTISERNEFITQVKIKVSKTFTRKRRRVCYWALNNDWTLLEETKHKQ